MADRQSPSSGFEGVAGRLAAPVMARMNRDMELAAIDELDPASEGDVLSIGFGPGVGIAELARRRPEEPVCGIDPSATMVEVARRRNRRAVDAGRVVLRQAGAGAIPFTGDSFDAVVAVNSVQLWEPLDVSLGEVARVLRPGGLLVTVTHRWALEKRSPVDDWLETVTAILRGHRFVTVESATRAFRSGPAVTMRARAGPGR